MNLTIALILAQNFGTIQDTDWTVNIITRISIRYFRYRGDFLVFHYYTEQPEDFIMQRVIKNLSETKKFLITYYNCTRRDDDPLPFLKPKGIIVFMDFSKQTFFDNIYDFHLKIIRNLNRQLRVIVVLQHHKYVKDNEVLFLLEKSWNKNIRNVIIINSVITDFRRAGIKLFCWRPSFDFNKNTGIKHDNINKITLSAEERIKDVNIILQNKTVYQVINSENIRGHSLNISVAVTPPYVWLNSDLNALNGKQIENLTTSLVDGIEIYILREFQKKFNLTGYFIIHPPELVDIHNLKEEDNSEYSVLEETAMGISDIAIGGTIASEDMYSFFGASAPYLQDDMLLYVQEAREIPRWKNLFLIFHYKLWIFIGVVLILVSITTYFKFRSGRHPKGKIDFSISMMTAWATILSQPLPTTVSDKMRLFFLASLLYGMHISTFYQSGLITVIHKKFYDTPINTIEEARAANMSVCLSGITYDYYDIDILSDQLEYLPATVTELNYTRCLDKVTENENVMALLPRKTTEYTIPLQYLDENYRKTITHLKKRLISFPVSMYLTKGSPYRKPLDFVIRGLLEFGIIVKWWDDIRLLKLYKAESKKFPAQGYSSISLRNAIGVFSVFLLSMLISIAVFLAELTWFKFNEWRATREKGVLALTVNMRFIH